MTPPGDQPDLASAAASPPPDATSDAAPDASGETKPARFVWPPRPIDLSEAEANWRNSPRLHSPRPTPTTPTTPDAPDLDLDLPESAPRPDQASPPAPRTTTATPAGPAGINRPRSNWRQIEEAWLGLTTPTLAERLSEAGWIPEPPGAACARCASTIEAASPDLTDSDDGRCSACRDRKLRWSRAVRLAEYDGLIRDVIHEIKFTAWRRLGVEAGRLLGRRLDAELAAAGLPRDQRDRLVLVPVPISFWRRMSRGIDHALAICRGVQMETGGRVVRALGRRHRPSQVSVPASRRGTNVSGSMYPRLGAGSALEGRWVVVVDDVRTSGATLAEACRTVRTAVGRGGGRQRLGSGRGGSTKDGGSNGPIEVWTAVLGVAEDDRRSGGSR